MVGLVCLGRQSGMMRRQIGSCRRLPDPVAWDKSVCSCVATEKLKSLGVAVMWALACLAADRDSGKTDVMPARMSRTFGCHGAIACGAPESVPPAQDSLLKLPSLEVSGERRFPS